MTLHPDPRAAFDAVAGAVAAGDWDACFAAFTTTDLRRLAGMGLLGVIGRPGGDVILTAHGVDAEAVRAVVEAGAAVVESATRPWQQLPPSEQAAWSAAHRDLVRAHTAATERAVRSAADLPGLVAAIERHRRETEGGGSVSSRLFVGEALVDVVVDGNRARGTRRYPNGTTDPVAFRKERGGWRVSILTR